MLSISYGSHWMYFGNKVRCQLPGFSLTMTENVQFILINRHIIKQALHIPWELQLTSTSSHNKWYCQIVYSCFWYFADSHDVQLVTVASGSKQMKCYAFLCDSALMCFLQNITEEAYHSFVKMHSTTGGKAIHTNLIFSEQKSEFNGSQLAKLKKYIPLMPLYAITA